MKSIKQKVLIDSIKPGLLRKLSVAPAFDFPYFPSKEIRMLIGQIKKANELRCRNYSDPKFKNWHRKTIFYLKKFFPFTPDFVLSHIKLSKTHSFEDNLVLWKLSLFIAIRTMLRIFMAVYPLYKILPTKNFWKRKHLTVTEKTLKEMTDSLRAYNDFRDKYLRRKSPERGFSFKQEYISANKLLFKFQVFAREYRQYFTNLVIEPNWKLVPDQFLTSFNFANLGTLNNKRLLGNFVTEVRRLAFQKIIKWRTSLSIRKRNAFIREEFKKGKNPEEIQKEISDKFEEIGWLGLETIKGVMYRKKSREEVTRWILLGSKRFSKDRIERDMDMIVHLLEGKKKTKNTIRIFPKDTTIVSVRVCD